MNIERRNILPPEKDPQYRPVVKYQDYDTCRIYCPYSSQYISFFADNVNDEFLQTRGAAEDGDRNGVVIRGIRPYVERISADSKGNDVGDHSEEELARMAPKYGVQTWELEEAFVIANEVLINSLKGKHPGSNSA